MASTIDFVARHAEAMPAKPAIIAEGRSLDFRTLNDRANKAANVLQALGCVAGFFVASYTGALLSATNQPMWSDTVWLAPLFLASAASTSRSRSS